MEPQVCRIKKCVLIRGPLLFPEWHVSSVSAIPDIGLAYINASLIQEGVDSFIIDAPGEAPELLRPLADSKWMMQGLKPDEIVARIPSDANLIGISCMHGHRWLSDRLIVDLILKKFPNTPLILGGEHASACFEEVLQEFTEIYAVAIGEGDLTIKELVKCLDTSGDRNKIKGIAYYCDDSKKIIKTERRERIGNLDSLPRPSWKGVPLNKYFERKSGINSFSRASLPILSSRGCPFACHFCSSPQMWSSKWYRRGADSVFNEMLNNYQAYGVKHFDFVDLTLGLDRSSIRELACKIIASNISFTWALPIGTRVESLDRETIALLAKAGLQRVLFSPESSSDSTLKVINKNFDYQHFYNVVRWCVDAGIVVKIAFIVGFPGQKTKDILDNWKMIFKLIIFGVHDIVCLSFVPYPGTILFKQLGVVYDYKNPHATLRLNSDLRAAKSWSSFLSSSFIKRYVLFTMGGFYLLQFFIRPYRVGLLIYRLATNSCTTNFESLILNSVRQFFYTRRKYK